MMEKIQPLTGPEMKMRIDAAMANQRVSTPVVTEISKRDPLYVEFMNSIGSEEITIKRLDENTLQITDLWGVTFQLKKLK